MCISAVLPVARKHVVLALASVVLVSMALGQSPNPNVSKSARAASPSEREGSQRTETLPRALHTDCLGRGRDLNEVGRIRGDDSFHLPRTGSARAKALSDKRLKPYLVDERAHVKLVVPSMEKVGQLRQSAPPERRKILLDVVFQ